MTEILDMPFDGAIHAICAPDFLWVEQTGLLQKDGQEWLGHLFFFASKEPPVEQGRSINSIGDKHTFAIDKGLHKRPGEDWNFTMITFASPFGNLKIESPSGVAEVSEGVCPCP